MSNCAPVLAVGIEVGSHLTVKKWIDDGELPVLASIVERGCMSPLSTVANLSSGSIWPTFSTGTLPLKNGQFFTHMQLDDGSYRINKKYADDVDVPPFWDALGKAGRRVFTFDIAQTRPIRNFNGVNLCAWGSEYPAWPRSSWPKPLMKEVVRNYGGHPLVNDYRLSIRPRTESEISAFYDKLCTGLERKGSIASDVLARERWDLAVIVFPEVHWAMHAMWQTIDKDHPDHDAALQLPVENVFLDLFRKLDKWLGRFMDLMPDVNAIVFSGSGTGPNYSGWHLLPEFLTRIGMGVQGERSQSSTISSFLPMRAWGSYKIRKIEDLLSVRVIKTLKALIPAPLWDRATRRLLYAGNEWARSKAFCLPNDYSGAIRVNLKGREPSGIVAPGGEFASVCGEIEDELMLLKNPATGKPAVAEVFSPEARYGHENTRGFPDLVVVWANDAPITELTSDRIGTISGEFPERRSGAHRDDSFLAMTLPLQVNHGEEIPDCALVDIAPTIYSLLEVPAPDYFDGRSLLS